MKFVRFVSILCVVSLAAGALAGCTSQAAESVVTVSTSGDALPASAGNAQPASDATYVQVQSIDGTSITALVGTLGNGDAGMPQGDAPSGDGEAQAEAPSGTPSSDNGGQQAEMPSGTPASDNGGQQAEAPSGTPSSDGGGQQAEMPSGGGRGFTAGDETITFTIGDSTAITLADGTTGTIDDIAIDDVLALTLDDDSVALSVMIQQSFGAEAPTSTEAAG